MKMKEIDLTMLPIGTRVWNLDSGIGTITEISSGEFPVLVTFECYNMLGSFTSQGKRHHNAAYPSLAPSEQAWLENPKDPWENYVFPIPDKSLVWCWDNGWRTIKVLRFYDAVNNSFFDNYGNRNSKNRVANYNHIESFKGEEPEWATEARKLLEE